MCTFPHFAFVVFLAIVVAVRVRLVTWRYIFYLFFLHFEVSSFFLGAPWSRRVKAVS